LVFIQKHYTFDTSNEADGLLFQSQGMIALDRSPPKRYEEVMIRVEAKPLSRS
jgi:hypothetical protein